MEIGNNMAMRNNTSFGMALKLANGTTVNDLRKYVEKEARIKCDGLPLDGLDKMIKGQANNTQVDIVYNAKSSYPVSIIPKTEEAKSVMGDSILMSDNFTDDLVRARREYDETITLIEKTKNPVKKFFLKLYKYVQGKSAEKMVKNDPRYALPNDLVEADYNARLYEGRVNKIQAQNSKIADALKLDK